MTPPCNKMEVQKVFDAKDLFLTENLSLDLPTVNVSSPKVVNHYRKMGNSKMDGRRPSKNKITADSNVEVSAAYRRNSRPKAIVNFSLQKNEIVYAHIMSNIRSIFKSIENKVEQSFSKTYNGGILMERRDFNGRTFEQAKRSNKNRVSSEKYREAKENFHQNSTLTLERSLAQVSTRDKHVNTLLRGRNFISTKGQSIETNRHERNASKSEEYALTNRAVNKKPSVHAPNKENVCPTSGVGSFSRLQSLKKLGPSATDTTVSNHNLERNSMAVPKRWQKATLTELAITKAMAKVSQSITRKQKFLIRSNTNYPADRNLVRQCSSGSILDGFVD